MAIRNHFPFSGYRYIGNIKSKEVHDLLKEDISKNGCQIDEIKIQHIRKFKSLAEAYGAKFDPCDKCLPNEINIESID